MKEMNSLSQEKILQLQNLSTYGILANGRAGSDFLQSLYDGHPEVLTFNGFFLFYDFWNNSFSNKISEISLVDFVEEFTGKFLYKLKSRYDIQERKDQLGPNFNQSLELDIEQFKKYSVEILSYLEFNSKNSLLALTSAYHLCLGRSLDTLKVFLHHPHIEEECIPFLKDFPTAKLLFMTRDPRANLISSVTNYSKYYPEAAGIPLVYSYINSIFSDTHRYLAYTSNVIALKIETLDQMVTHQALCKELGIHYHNCMTQSTWGNLLWHGDRLSQKKAATTTSRDILRNGWEEKISKRELIIVNSFTREMRQHYGYKNKETSSFYKILLPLIILFPMALETPYLGWQAIKEKGFKNFCINWFYYMKRTLFLLKSMRKRSFSDQKFL